MDPVLVFIGIVVVFGVGYYFLKDDSKPTSGTGGSTPVKPVAPAKAEVKKEVKKAAPKKAAPTAPKAPTAKALNAMTKKEIEQTARDFGVELDARKTKANMVKDFQSGVKAQKK